MSSGASRSVQPGTVFDGKYEIVGLLGAGGMGEVFKARHVHLNTFRCIKVMKPGLLADDTYRVRFLREARLATQVHHPNVAVVHDFEIRPDGTSYMVTEFIDGTTLRQWSTANGRFPLPLAAEVAVQVLGGLDHIHRRGLLHRDISADNIMLSYDADDRLVAKIIDLGVAKDTSASTDTTQSGMLIGNPKYMSPEQLGELADGEQLDGRADLYCLGVVLYEMLLGVPPFQSKTPNGYIIKHLTQPPPPFAETNASASFPVGLEAVVFKALEKDRRNRYADARRFAAALAPFLTRATGSYTRADVISLSDIGEDTMVLGDGATEVVSSGAGTRELSDAEAFQIAWEDGSSAAWQQFLGAHGNSSQAARARELLAEAEAFERANGAGTETGLREFLRSWPEGRHRLEAEIRLMDVKRVAEEEAWTRARDANTFAAMRDFLLRHSGSPHAEEARAIMDERLAYETARALDSEDGWEEYLRKYPDNAEVQKRLEAVRANEEEVYRIASEEKTAAAWEVFLDKFPAGRRSARAEMNRREAIAFERAREGGRRALEEFLRQHPNGLLLRDARRILKRVVDDEDFENARSHDSLAAWKLYLTSHPAGAHRDEARERLVALEDEKFAALLASKDAKRAAEFLADFPDSPRRAEVAGLRAKWEETSAVQRALDLVAKGDGEGAAALIGKIADPEPRAEVERAVDAWRDQQAWEEASAANTAGALQAYLDRRAEGRWASEARRRLARMESDAAQSEPRDFDKAWESGSAAAWDAYLAAHPTAKRAAEARRMRQEAAEFEMAAALNTPQMLRAFIKAWPEGRHRLDAEVRLRALR